MKLYKKVAAALLVLSSATMPVSAFAQSQVELTGDVKAVETSVDEAGNEVTKLVEPTLIVPGGRLIFATDFVNNSEDSFDNFVVTNKVHEAVRLAPEADPELTVSVDGGETWGVLASLSFVEENGESRSAVHADVTHVRWTIPVIAAGEKGRVEYPAIIR